MTRSRKKPCVSSSRGSSSILISRRTPNSAAGSRRPTAALLDVLPVIVLRKALREELWLWGLLGLCTVAFIIPFFFVRFLLGWLW